jgi:hypothetical protein
VSAVWFDRDEAADRGLFERRARMLGAGAPVPLLESVLRAARESSCDAAGGRGRAWRGIVLAAACLVSVLRTAPIQGSMAAISPDGDRAIALGDGAGAICDDGEARSCRANPPLASMAPLVPTARNDGACSVPPASYAAPRMLWCEGSEVNRSEMP